MQGKPEAGPPTVMHDSEKVDKTAFLNKGEATTFLDLLLTYFLRKADPEFQQKLNKQD